MATIATPVRHVSANRFYVTMALIFVAIAFGGFFATYWLQVARGSFTGSPMLHLHGLLFSLWPLFFLSQATLVANRKVRVHRAWGLFGISLATAMLFTGLAVAIEGMRNRIDAGFGEVGRSFAIVPISGITLFAVLVGAAIANTRRPEWHKRFMLVATAGILQAALARFFFLAATGGGPGMRPGLGPPQSIERTMMPAAIVALLVIAAMIHDRRSRGRVHPAYWWGFGALLAVFAARPVIGYSNAWLRFTDVLLAF
jgi:hypothetical protein